MKYYSLYHIPTATLWNKKYKDKKTAEKIVKWILNKVGPNNRNFYDSISIIKEKNNIVFYFCNSTSAYKNKTKKINKSEFELIEIDI